MVVGEGVVVTSAVVEVSTPVGCRSTFTVMMLPSLSVCSTSAADARDWIEEVVPVCKEDDATADVGVTETLEVLDAEAEAEAEALPS